MKKNLHIEFLTYRNIDFFNLLIKLNKSQIINTRIEVFMEKTAYINSTEFQISSTAKLVTKLAEKFFNTEIKNNISYEEYQILDTIMCYPHVNSAILAQTLFQDENMTKKNINKLIKRNLIIEINEKPNEIRTHFYEITQEGVRIYKDTASQSDSMIVMLLKFISEKELISFLKTLKKIRKILISLEY